MLFAKIDLRIIVEFDFRVFLSTVCVAISFCLDLFLKFSTASLFDAGELAFVGRRLGLSIGDDRANVLMFAPWPCPNRLNSSIYSYLFHIRLHIGIFRSLSTSQVTVSLVDFYISSTTTVSRTESLGENSRDREMPVDVLS